MYGAARFTFPLKWKTHSRRMMSERERPGVREAEGRPWAEGSEGWPAYLVQ